MGTADVALGITLLLVAATYGAALFIHFKAAPKVKRMATDTYKTPEHGWVCFHCGESFPGTYAGQRRARAHFGSTPASTPACTIKAEDRLMLSSLRGFEDEARRLRIEVQRLRAGLMSVAEGRTLPGQFPGLNDAQRAHCSAIVIALTTLHPDVSIMTSAVVAKCKAMDVQPDALSDAEINAQAGRTE